MSHQLQLMDIQVETLFRCDAAGRLLAVNEPGDPEPGDRPAPRFFMGRTPQGNLWRFRHDLPDAVAHEIARLAASEPVSTALARLPSSYGAVRGVLQTHAIIRAEWRGPAYYFPDRIPAPSTVVMVDAANAQVLQPHFPALFSKLTGSQPCVAMVRDGCAVSVCFSSRVGSNAAEAGVETLPEFRGKGYAAAVVAGWARAVRRSGRIPLYSTAWDNHASQRVADKLRLILYGEDWSIV